MRKHTPIDEILYLIEIYKSAKSERLNDYSRDRIIETLEKYFHNERLSNFCPRVGCKNLRTKKGVYGYFCERHGIEHKKQTSFIKKVKAKPQDYFVCECCDKIVTALEPFMSKEREVCPSCGSRRLEDLIGSEISV